MKSLLLTLNQIVFTLLLYIAGALIIGAALFPSAMMAIFVWHNTLQSALALRILWMCLAVSAGYFLFGLSLIFIVGLIRMVFRVRLREGDYKIGSSEMLKWFVVNALFLIVRTAFMEFMMLTPFCSLFYRMMGAKLGHNVQINSKNVADHSLLEIGNNSVIGGNATVIGHSFESKGLKLAKVKIGKNVIIGLNAVVMPGVTIGDGTVIAAGAIVPKETVIEPNMIYFSRDNQVPRQR